MGNPSNTGPAAKVAGIFQILGSGVVREGCRRLTLYLESLYDRLDPDNVLESAALDKGYDADQIRERLALDGIQPVIPPISTRCKRLHSDKAPYLERNRLECFFDRLKQFRRVATRYDKLQQTFCATLHLVVAFRIAKNS